ncbi:MAG: tetratricopeptide repeat protein, partial [Planctomycetota bacterium]
ADQEPYRLRVLARVLEQHGGHDEMVGDLLEKSARLRVERVLSGNATANEIAVTAVERAKAGDLAAAAKLYRGALGKDYANTAWRLALIDVLTRAESFEQAQAETKTLLRLRPGLPAAVRRLEELSLLVEPESTVERAADSFRSN